MTVAVETILHQFDQLSNAERRELRLAIVERVPMSEDLTDDDFATLAAASFRRLDEEETPPLAGAGRGLAGRFRDDSKSSPCARH